MNKNKFEYVYIEDDELLRLSWESKARKLGIRLLCLKAIHEFMLNEEQIDKEETSIYIDSNLGNDQISGEEFAQQLHDRGFKKLFIASGFSAEKFSHLPWLGYAGKKRPF